MAEAGRIAKKENHDFIATGEVLGQRPFSQTRQALNRVATLAGVEVLRPLSARLLDETEAESRGMVNRGLLLDIAGRSRQRQLALAKHYNLSGYATPAGGCLLTDRGFSERLIKLLDHWPDCGFNDVELLKHGRIYWLALKQKRKPNKVLLVIGRNETEDKKLKGLKEDRDVLIELKEELGPTSLLRLPNNVFKQSQGDIAVNAPPKLTVRYLDLNEEFEKEELMAAAARLTAYHAPKLRGRDITLTFVV